MNKTATKPVPIDLSKHGELVEGGHEFLRLWAKADGPFTCFVNPRPLGPDPIALGVALAEAIGYGARAYARTTGIDEAEASARIWEGLAPERVVRAPQPADDDFITYTGPR